MRKSGSGIIIANPTWPKVPDSQLWKKPFNRIFRESFVRYATVYGKNNIYPTIVRSWVGTYGTGTLY
jgi:hypothetical protein